MTQSERDREILNGCMTAYEMEDAEWLPAARMREVMDALVEGGEVTGRDLYHTLRRYGQVTSARVWNDAEVRGYYKRQVLEALKTFEESDREEDDARHGHDLDECAERIVGWVKTISPDWEMLIDTLTVVRNFDAKTTIASLMSYTLEQRLHMIVPAYDAFTQPLWSPTPQTCPVCNNDYRMEYPGQATCLNSDCGRVYHKNKTEVAQVEG